MVFIGYIAAGSVRFVRLDEFQPGSTMDEDPGSTPHMRDELHKLGIFSIANTLLVVQHFYTKAVLPGTFVVKSFHLTSFVMIFKPFNIVSF